tara:strand:- start:56 stop:1474 length:1419 start_codon:yes stop_codon:yes gene_type:complete
MGIKLSKRDVIKEIKEHKEFKSDLILVDVKHEVYQPKDKKIKSLKHNHKRWTIYYRCKIENHIDYRDLSAIRRVGPNCTKCRGFNLTTDQRISLLEAKHKKFYSYKEFKKTGYKESGSEIPINCPIHGIFYQIYSSHLSGQGCTSCFKKNHKTGKEIKKIVSKNTNGRISVINLEENKIYNPSGKCTIKCNVHYWHKDQKRKILKVFNKNLKCSYCTASNYMLEAYHSLHQLGISFEIEYFIKFSDKTNGYIDILLINKNKQKIFVEIDGEQHFNVGNLWQKNIKERKVVFKKTQQFDKKKDEYAKLNNIKLYRINYTQDIKEEIENIVKKNQFEINKKIKSYPVNLIYDGDKKAYDIHKMYIDGYAGSIIAKKYNTYLTYVSKILHGYRYRNVFLHFYPNGINTNYKFKRHKKFQPSKKEIKFLLNLFKGKVIFEDIRREFNKKFPTNEISKTMIGNFAKKNNFKSSHWKD